MKNYLKKLTAIAILFVFIFAVNDNAEIAHASTKNLSITPMGAVSFEAGEKEAIVSFNIENKEKSRVTIDAAKLKFNRQGFTVEGGISGKVIIESGEEAVITFYVTVTDGFSYSNAMGYLELKNGLDLVYGSTTTYDVFSNVESSKGEDGKYVVAVQISHSLDSAVGIVAGAENHLRIGVFNRGGTTIKNMDIKLVLPEGIIINNGSSVSNVGNVAVGARKSTSFSVSAEKNIESKTYPITVEISGFDNNNATVKTSKIIYIPVKSDGAGATAENISIINVSAPNEAISEEEFVVSFQVKNTGNTEAKNMKIVSDVPEGLLNKTRNTFIENTIAPGETKSYSVTYFSKDTVEDTYPIKISVETANGVAEGETVDSAIQYASVHIKNAGNDNVKTPQVMISDYSFGGTYIQAGQNFRVNLQFLNTSGKNLSNIKATLTSTEGTFIPVSSSNSFFIETIEKKGSASFNLMLNAKPDAEQKTHSLTIDLTYEDGAGNEFTAQDIISIPVMHETRLVVDDMVQSELFAGNPGGLSVQFYNMGKSSLNNLRVSAYGDFSTMESINYYVGNMEAGESDSYDFTIIPNQTGPMSGAVEFTYEDGNGTEQIYEVPFEFNVMDYPSEEEMYGEMYGEMMPEDQGTGMSKNLPYIIAVVALLLAVATFVIVKKYRKKKKHQELEIDE